MDKKLIGNRVVLMICSFFAGAAGNTSTLVGFSFATRYKEVFVSALSAGFGMSGLIPSLLNFAQNTGADLVRPFIILMLVWHSIISYCAWYYSSQRRLLIHHKFCSL